MDEQQTHLPLWHTWQHSWMPANPILASGVVFPAYTVLPTTVKKLSKSAETQMPEPFRSGVRPKHNDRKLNNK
eukprot:12378783-Ditylum_brightwellii.AAC.1